MLHLGRFILFNELIHLVYIISYIGPTPRLLKDTSMYATYNTLSMYIEKLRTSVLLH